MGRRKLRDDEPEVISDGFTVWVNDPTGCCIGRFSKHGVDVHRTGAEQLEGLPECLDCVHDLPPVESWDRFRSSMRAHHGVEIGPGHTPRFVAERL